MTQTPGLSRCTLAGFLHAETPDAILFGLGRAATASVWLPKSRLTITGPDTVARPAPVKITLPEWLARSRGLTRPDTQETLL